MNTSQVGVAGSAIHVPKFVDDLTRGFRDRSTFTRSGLTGFLDQYGASKDGQETLEQIGVLILARATDWAWLPHQGTVKSEKCSNSALWPSDCHWVGIRQHNRTDSEVGQQH